MKHKKPASNSISDHNKPRVDHLNGIMLQSRNQKRFQPSTALISLCINWPKTTRQPLAPPSATMDGSKKSKPKTAVLVAKPQD